MRAIWIPLLAALAGCPDNGTSGPRPASEYGAELFRDPLVFSLDDNAFACADCHDTVDPASPDRMWPGFSLAGVARRERFWGGDVLRLKDAVDACIVYFMLGRPLEDDSVEGRALYEYLMSISPGADPLPTLPMTVVENVIDVPRGDPTRGEVVYEQACASCHGDAHTGEGAQVDFILPEDTEPYEMMFPGVGRAVVIMDKVRKGRFFHIGGQMPPFSLEVLSDEDLGALMAFFEL